MANATAAAWRGIALGGAEDWWGAGDPAHCIEYQQLYPDAVKVAVDLDGFAVCGRPGEAGGHVAFFFNDDDVVFFEVNDVKTAQGQEKAASRGGGAI